MDDYFDAVQAAVLEAQRQDPDAVLPWSWWKEQAQRHEMTPNAVYTRAVKTGLYVPPDKRATETEAPDAVKEVNAPGADKPEGAAADKDVNAPPKTPHAPETPPKSEASSRPPRPAPRSRYRPPSEAASVSASSSPSPSSASEAAAIRSESIPMRSDITSGTGPCGEGIGDAIQSFAGLVERSAGLQQQVADQNRDLERTRAENRRLRQALRQLEGLAEEMRHVYRLALLPGDEE